MQESRQARKRLRDLKEKAYTIHDYVGKTGIEGVYEEQLRGFYGRKNFYADSKGNFLRELPGSRPALSGHRILLSISGELQEYAEQLLTQNEELRIVRKSKLGPVKKTVIAEKTPWIKGGAIVVMDPSNAEIITLACCPDLIPMISFFLVIKRSKSKKKEGFTVGLKTRFFLAQIWDQPVPLERERYNDRRQDFYDEKTWMTWRLLDLILPADTQLRLALDQIKTIAQAVEIQRQIERLQTLFPDYRLFYAIMNALYMSDEHEPFKQVLKGADKHRFFTLIQERHQELLPIKKSLDQYFNSLLQSYDKVLLVDLCRLNVAADQLYYNC